MEGDDPWEGVTYSSFFGNPEENEADEHTGQGAYFESFVGLQESITGASSGAQPTETPQQRRRDQSGRKRSVPSSIPVAAKHACLDDEQAFDHPEYPSYGCQEEELDFDLQYETYQMHVRKPPSAWTRRGVAEQENWSNVRPRLAASMVAAEAPPEPNTLCTRCENACIIRCKTCVSRSEGTGHTLLCHDCDKALHQTAHFHQREVWVGGYFEAIPAQQEYDGEGRTEYTCMYVFALFSSFRT